MVSTPWALPSVMFPQTHAGPGAELAPETGTVGGVCLENSNGTPKPFFSGTGTGPFC